MNRKYLVSNYINIRIANKETTVKKRNEKECFTTIPGM